MRRFYIFNINEYFKILTKNDPYNLYKQFDNIYHFNKYNIKQYCDLYNKITIPINKNKLNNNLYNYYLNDESYTKYLNTHHYNNYYNDEETVLTIGNNYMIIDTTSINPIFFDKLKIIKNLFVCDFQNQDYFWLENIA